MTRGLAVLAVVAAALVAVPLTVADAEFTDPEGDASGAADVVGVVVGNDARNRVAFQVELEAGLYADQHVQIWLDTDRNKATGDDGSDYIAWLDAKRRGLKRWNGTDWVAQPSMTARASDFLGTLTYGIDRRELGDTASFAFHVEGVRVSGGKVVARDVAPNGEGIWSYETVAKTYGLKVSKLARPFLSSDPERPLNNNPFTLGFGADRTDSIEPPSAGRYTCKATVAGKPIATRVGPSRVFSSTRLGFGQCTVQLTRRAKGNALKLTMTAMIEGKLFTRSYAARVR